MEYTETEYEDTVYRTYTGDHVEASVIVLRDDGGYLDGYLERIDVDEGFRGRGIGTAAIREIRRDFWRLWTAPDGEDSARLYARLGELAVGEGATARVPQGLDELHCLDQGYGVYEVA